MRAKTTPLLVFISFFLLFSAFFYNYLSINLWDYDFWWHIATGRYIVEAGDLPHKDPFSYTSELEENKNLFPDRETLILKQYWLSQVIFYFIYSNFGAKGIIILRSLILLFIILSVLLGLKRNGVNFYLSFIFVVIVYLTTLTYTGERPALFTMLFSVLVFLLYDEYMRNRGKTFFLLIPVMLVWANLHGGFIIGIIIITIFLIGETPNIILKRSVFTRKEIFIFYVVSLLSIVVSAINPNGFAAFMTLSFERVAFHEGIQEYMPIFSLYKEKTRELDFGYIFFLLLFPVVVFLRGRKMTITYLILLSGLLFMSITALRFMFYYVAIGSIILGREINILIEKGFLLITKRHLINVIAIMMLLSSTVYFVGKVGSKDLMFGEATNYSIPKLAVDFIEKNHLPGNLYNEFGFGGYIAWRLCPWKKNFVDTRSLNSTVNAETRWILKARESLRDVHLPEGKTPLWERLIGHYKINIILLDTLDIVGTVPPLLLELLESDKWVPVHVDLISVVFVRNKDSNEDIIKRFSIPKEIIYNAVISRISQWALINKKNPRYLLSLGDVFYHMGKMEDALTAYEYALARLPHNNLIKQKIKQIKEEIDKSA